jgi:hypothetical protein
MVFEGQEEGEVRKCRWLDTFLELFSKIKESVTSYYIKTDRQCLRTGTERRTAPCSRLYVHFLALYFVILHVYLDFMFIYGITEVNILLKN